MLTDLLAIQPDIGKIIDPFKIDLHQPALPAQIGRKLAAKPDHAVVIQSGQVPVGRQVHLPPQAEVGRGLRIISYLTTRLKVLPFPVERKRLKKVVLLLDDRLDSGN